MPPSDCQREAVKKVLIVSPNWPPVAYPDMQRARMACAHLREFGWEPLILSADPDEQVGPKDALLAKTLPEDLRSWQAKAIPKALTRLIGIQSVGYRSFFHIARLGSQLIARERVDVVFFSTTMFMLFALGPYWKWKHRVPFVLDFQDPWVSDYQVRSGGFWMRCKRFLTQAFARILEPLAGEPVLQNYHLLPSVRGDFLAKLGRLEEARAEFERAASLTQNARERALLLERAARCARA